MGEKNSLFAVKKNYQKKKINFLLDIFFLLVFLFGKGTSVYASQQVIELENISQEEEVEILQGSGFQLNISLDPQEETIVKVPKGIGFSSNQMKKEYGSVSFSIEGNELDTHQSERAIRFAASNQIVGIRFYGLLPGEHILRVENNTNKKVLKINVSPESLLQQNSSKGQLPKLPQLPALEPLHAMRFFSVNPLPPVGVGSFDLTNYFAFNGNASVDSTYTNVALPVPPQSISTMGTMWSKEKIDLSKDFSMEIYSYMYNTALPSAVYDGITLTFHNDPRGTSAIGSIGMCLAVYGGKVGSHEGSDYVANGIAVEFDPSQNTDFDQNVAEDHIALMKTGDYATMMTQTYHNKYGEPLTNMPLRNNNKWMLLELSWNATTKKITVKYSNIDDFGNKTNELGVIESNPIDPISEFGDNKVYWGFTTSVGWAQPITGTYYMGMKKMPEISVGEISKGVKNVTKKESAYSENTIANNDDILEYQLSFKNTASYQLPDFEIKDSLKTGLQKYQASSTTYEKLDSGGGIVSSGSLPDSCWNNGTEFSNNFGLLNTGESIIVKFRVKLDAADVAITSITNTFDITSAIGVLNTSNQTKVTLNTRFKITEIFVDENGNTIAGKDDVVTEVEPGGNFTNNFPLVDGYSIDGYTIDSGDKVPSTPSSNINISNIQKDYKVTYIYDRRIKVGIRQEVQQVNSKVIVPTTGYITLQVNNAHQGSDKGSSYNQAILSGEEGSLNTYSTIRIQQESQRQGILIQPVVPEYYAYTGWSDGKNSYPATTPIQLTYENVKDYKIVIYIKPTTTDPAFYSWSYGQSTPYMTIP